jgi:hypothetical protein
MVQLTSLKKVADGLIYISVFVGLLLLYLASSQVPSWLLASLIIGEIAYAISAVAVARGIRQAYYAIIVLAILVLVVSLPQPDHYAFATQGEIAAFLVFVIGSALQIGLLILVPLYLVRSRKMR